SSSSSSSSEPEITDSSDRQTLPAANTKPSESMNSQETLVIKNRLDSQLPSSKPMEKQSNQTTKIPTKKQTSLPETGETNQRFVLTSLGLVLGLSLLLGWLRQKRNKLG
ncbi:LPXTG cell wall anchor domain-containing protein, partial [Levilactobacillus bambusae]